MRDTLTDLNKRWFPYLQAVRCHRNKSRYKSRYWYEVRVMNMPLPLRERIEYLSADLRAGKTSARAFDLGDITLSDYVASMLEQAVSESPDDFGAIRAECADLHAVNEALKAEIESLWGKVNDLDAFLAEWERLGSGIEILPKIVRMRIHELGLITEARDGE